MLANLLAHGVDLHQRAIHGFRSGHFAGHPNGKENRAEIPFAHARNVNAPGGAACSKIELAVKKTLRRVVVRIHNDGREMQLARLFRDGVSGHRYTRKTQGGNPQNGEQLYAKHSLTPAPRTIDCKRNLPEKKCEISTGESHRPGYCYFCLTPNTRERSPRAGPNASFGDNTTRIRQPQQ